jgi:carboxymethylenebutenolidase
MEKTMPAYWTRLNVDGQEMEAYVASPGGEGPHPAVIIAQEIWGVNGYLQSIANRLAADGIVGVVPALFHREGPGIVGLFEETELALERLGRYRDDEILTDVRATLLYLQGRDDVQSDRIGIIGFCVGGRISYFAAAAVDGLACAVDFYGGRCFVAMGDGPTPFELTKDIKVPLLGLFGEDDANPSPEDVANIAAALAKYGKTYEFHSYPGSGHGFNCEERPAYRRDASLDAWAKVREWFARYLKE